MRKSIYLEPRYRCRNCGKEFTTSKLDKEFDSFLITSDIAEMLNDENKSEILYNKIPHICDSDDEEDEVLIGVADLIGFISNCDGVITIN